MSGVVYALCDPATGQPRYVGKTTATAARRLREHIASAARSIGRQRRLACWIRSLTAPPTLTILEIDPPDLDEAERAWIQMYRRYGANLCNMTDGGDGQSPGYVPSAESRAKNSASSRGRVKTEQERRKLSAALMGHETSAETRAKIGAANCGRVRSDAVREVSREQAKRRVRDERGQFTSQISGSSI